MLTSGQAQRNRNAEAAHSGGGSGGGGSGGGGIGMCGSGGPIQSSASSPSNWSVNTPRWGGGSYILTAAAAAAADVDEGMLPEDDRSASGYAAPDRPISSISASNP